MDQKLVYIEELLFESEKIVLGAIMKLLYWMLMILPGVAFFVGDFGDNNIPLRIFGICLILIVVFDVVKNKDVSQYICKIIYFPIFLIIWTAKIKSQIKKNRREQRVKYFAPWYF